VTRSSADAIQEPKAQYPPDQPRFDATPFISDAITGSAEKTLGCAISLHRRANESATPPAASIDFEFPVR